MEQIIAPVDINLLKAELTPEKKLQNTNKGGNELYIVTAHNAPNVMKEIGRLREESFRMEGGSSGLSMDIDEFDTMEVPYRQLIVWDPEADAIIGGYRFILGTDVRFDAHGKPVLATAHMFDFSDEFIRVYLPHTIELGRAFVSVGYQTSKAGPKSIFALDNLWDGIASVLLHHPDMHYFFGKITLYPTYPRPARDLLLHFMDKHFPDRDRLVWPMESSGFQSSVEMMDLILKDSDFKADYRNLKNAIKGIGSFIPPLYNSYMNLSATTRVFGTAVNHEFSGVEETAILVCFDELHTEKSERHLLTFLEEKVKKAKRRFPSIDEAEMLRRLRAKILEVREKNFDRFRKHRKS